MSSVGCAPASFALEVTARCPRRCRYCYQGIPGAPQQPSLQALAERLRLARGPRFIDLTGGEPLSHPQVLPLLDLTRALGLSVGIISDGAEIDAALARALAHYDLRRVQLTLLSTERALHDSLKGLEPGAPSAFDQTLRALALLRREGVPTSVSFICMRPNAEHLEGVARLCFALGVEALSFTRLCALEEAARRAELWPTAAQVGACLEALPGLAERYDLKIRNAVAVPHRVHPAGGGCGLMLGRPNYTIDVEGRVRPCSLSSKRLGHISEGWPALQARYVEWQATLWAGLPDGCRACAHHGTCAGGCRESALRAGDGVDPLCLTLDQMA